MNSSARNYCTDNDIKIDDFVALKKSLGVTKIEKIFPNHKPEKNERFVDLSLIYQITYTGNYSVIEVANKISRNRNVQYAEPYVLPQPLYVPNDSIIGADSTKFWHLTKINAFGAWDISKGDTNITIGITDMGWDNTHVDLLGNVKVNVADPINGTDDDGDGYIDNYLGWDLGNNDNDAQQETSNHGTHVSGLSAAVTDNGNGVASVGFNTKFLPIKISNSSGILTHAYQGIVYAADHDCFIINCSWGSTVPGQFQKDVIDYATINKGCLVVAACGNNNNETLFYPAAYGGVLTVAASEQNDYKKNNSNFGYYVDISAPGEYMWSTVMGGYGLNGGTSMAAPVVSGAAALVKAMNPTFTNQQVAAQLRATADDVYSLNPGYLEKLGNGRLNVFRALSENSKQFVELTAHQVADGNNNIFVEDDTLNITADFFNYLSPISGLTATLSTASPYVTILDGTTNLPTFAENQNYNSNPDPFQVKVLNGVPLNESVLFKVELNNGVYYSTDYFYVILNPDYINLEENLIKTTITSKGKIGYNDVNNSIGLGFNYNGEQLLYECGLMIGVSTNQVSDCVRGSGTQEQDFASVENVKYNPPYLSAVDLLGEMNDVSSSLPLNVSIQQKSFVYNASPNDKFVIVSYLIKNNDVVPQNNMFVGLFADWDIINYATNQSGVDVSRKMGFARSKDADSTYGAIKVLSDGIFVNYSLDNVSGGAGGVDISDGFTTAEKYTTLSSQKSSAGMPNGQDVAHVVTSGPLSIGPGDSTFVSFAIIAGESLSDIQNSADAAQEAYDNIIGVEEVESDYDFLIMPNPAGDWVLITTTLDLNTIAVKNYLGQTVLISNEPKLNTSKLTNGVYFVEVHTSKGVVVKKIVIKK